MLRGYLGGWELRYTMRKLKARIITKRYITAFRIKNIFLILKAVIYLFVIILALSFLIVYLNSHPPRYPLNIPPSSYGLKFESVEFRTPDKIILSGWFIKSVSSMQ